jgi:putative (di)nucleoside polyphosphate hydrolase
MTADAAPVPDIAALPYRPGVGVMVANGDGHVFVGQRLDNVVEAWQMPQGGIDEGEDAEIAALRELEEETGIAANLVTIIARSAAPLDYDLPAELVTRLWRGRYRGQRQHWFLLRFDGHDDDVNIATAHPEFRAWQWLHPNQLVDVIVPFKRDLYAAVLAEFSPHLRALSNV